MIDAWEIEAVTRGAQRIGEDATLGARRGRDTLTVAIAASTMTIAP